MVQEPSGIIEVVSERSRASSSANVAEHLGFRAVTMEDRMAQERRLPGQGFRDKRSSLTRNLAHGEGERLPEVENGEQCLHLLKRRGFVQGNAHRPFIEHAQIDAVLGRRFNQFGAVTAAEVNPQCVEAGRVSGRPQPEAEPGQSGGQDRREPVHASGDAAQSFRAVIDRIHRGQDGQEHLGGADVAGGFLAADVLLPRLQREPQGRPAGRVLGHAHQTAGHLAFEAVAGGKVGRVRTAISHRHTKALRAAHGHVRAELARRLKQDQAEQIRGHHGQRLWLCACSMKPG